MENLNIEELKEKAKDKSELIELAEEEGLELTDEVLEAIADGIDDLFGKLPHN